jgi:hypothetical protein
LITRAPLGGGVPDPLGDRAHASAPGAVEHLDDHQLCLRGDTDDPAGVAGGAGDPGDVRPVPLPVVERLPGRTCGQVDTVHVVDVAVAVVVDSVAGSLVEVRPDVRAQVDVVQPGAGVKDRDRHAAAFGEIPGIGQVEHSAGGNRPLVTLQRLGVGLGNPRAGALAVAGGWPVARQVRQGADAELGGDVAPHREGVAVLRA